MLICIAEHAFQYFLYVIVVINCQINELIEKPTPLFTAEFSISVFLLLHISRLLHFLAKNRMMKTTMTKAATTLEMSNGKLATNQIKVTSNQSDAILIIKNIELTEWV